LAAGIENRITVIRAQREPLWPWLLIEFGQNPSEHSLDLTYLSAQRWMMRIVSSPQHRSTVNQQIRFFDSRPNFTAFRRSYPINTNGEPTDFGWNDGGTKVWSVLMIPATVVPEASTDYLSTTLTSLSKNMSDLLTHCSSDPTVCKFFNLRPREYPRLGDVRGTWNRVSTFNSELSPSVAYAGKYNKHKKDVELLNGMKNALERRRKQLVSSYPACSIPDLSELDADLCNILHRELPVAERNLQKAGDSLIRSVFSTNITNFAVTSPPPDLNVPSFYKK
jgi:hypothetical protein